MVCKNAIPSKLVPNYFNKGINVLRVILNFHSFILMIIFIQLIVVLKTNLEQGGWFVFIYHFISPQPIIHT